MGMLDSFNLLNSVHPFEQVGEEYVNQIPAEFDKPPEDPHVWLDRYAKFVDRPKFNPNFDGYISPYASGHWGASSDIMQSIAMNMELGPLQERLDPNKIFTSDIAALKTLAADQIKIIKVFERRLLESLNDKGKFGLNEDDIEALQALTSARSAVTQINKEQIAVKKSIAELKIKQQQQAGATTQQTQGGTGRGMNVFDVGRSMLDQIFDVPMQQPQPTDISNYPTVDVDQAANVLNEIVDVNAVPDTTVFESEKPTVYVVVGDSDDDRQFVTYSQSGEVLSDYPEPTAKIQKVDRDSMKAYDEFMVEYPVKFKKSE